MSIKAIHRQELKDWLDLLTERDEGKIIFINLFFSFEQKLVTKEVIQSFFIDCLSVRSSTFDQAFACFRKTCQDTAKYFGLFVVDPLSMDDSMILITTMNSLTFHRYIVNDSPPSSAVKNVLPIKPDSRDPDDEIAYRDLLEELVSSPDWYKISGSMGKPYPDPSVVWLTQKSYMDAEVGYVWNPSLVATKIRDILGLVDTTNNTYILSLQFRADQLKGILRAISNFRIARPLFADNGNRRFAVHLENAAARNIYRDDWGLTVNLGKLQAKGMSEINGVPERVSSPIPLSHIGAHLKVEAIGWVNEDRGNTVYVDDDAIFIQWLRNSITIDQMKTHILTVAERP